MIAIAIVLTPSQNSPPVVGSFHIWHAHSCARRSPRLMEDTFDGDIHPSPPGNFIALYHVSGRMANATRRRKSLGDISLRHSTGQMAGNTFQSRSPLKQPGHTVNVLSGPDEAARQLRYSTE